MPNHQAYYSILQYCPDRGRAEAANIGVLLLCPSLNFVEVRTDSHNARITRFFGRSSYDAARLKLIKQGIEHRIRVEYDWSEGLTGLERFISTRGNDVQLTPPRSMKVENPSVDLDELFAELVGGEQHSHSGRLRPEAFRHLDVALRAPALEGRIRFDQTIEIPVLARSVVVPYVYENGVTNLVKPHTFAQTAKGATSQAAELAVEGNLLHRHSAARKMQLIVISEFPERAEQAAESITQLFSEYGVRIVREDGIGEFVSEIERSAH